jgi:putative nucleotidyltransferase with HDIG domain
MTTLGLSAAKQVVAVVDSFARHREEVYDALRLPYDVAAFSDGKEALKSFSAEPPSVIIACDGIQPSGAFNFIKAIREDRKLQHLPVIFVSEESGFGSIANAKAAGATEYLVKPYLRSKLIHTVSHLLNAKVEQEWEVLPEVQKAALKNTVSIFGDIADVMSASEVIPFTMVKDSVQPLVTAIESNDFKSILDGVRNHDDYTYAHSMRVATMLSILGHAAGFKNDEQLLLASGGLLHDVGKMMIPHNILNKPGRLDEAEFEIMKTHVPETIKYLQAASDIPNAVFIIAEQHHEKLDGMGYPHGLQGGQLNELARMAAIVDVFSALTDRRIYKPPMEAEKAFDIMLNQMTGHLDQKYVNMFREILLDVKVL